ncbi:MAG: helix-turn-helix transcriptional regulator [Planctomycetota bacterium]|nr:helix-turn-helix transcriptional regulator [Planctomycetota bacterium]
MQADLTIGQTLRLLRRQRALTLSTLAARLGVDPSYVSRVENGQLTPARVHLAPWAEAVGADVDAIHYGFGFVPPDLVNRLWTDNQARRDVRELLGGIHA